MSHSAKRILDKMHAGETHEFLQLYQHILIGKVKFKQLMLYAKCSLHTAVVV